MSEELVSRADEGVSGCQRLRTRARRRRSQHHHVAAELPSGGHPRVMSRDVRRPSRRVSCRDELQTLLKGAPHMRDPCRSV